MHQPVEGNLSPNPKFTLGRNAEIGMPYSRLLLRLERLNALSAEDRLRVTELPMTVANFSANEVVSRSGDRLTRCTLVLSGFLYSHKPAGYSRRQITSLLVPGEIADLSGLYCPTLDHSVSALGPAVVAFIPHTDFQSMLDGSPRLAKAFWREALIGSAVLREWVTSLGKRDALARVARVVCELAVRLQAVDLARNLCFSIPWTQIDVADACGISGVHANRVIQELRRLGLVEWNSRHINILDWEGLAKVGDFSDDYLQLRSVAPTAPPQAEMHPKPEIEPSQPEHTSFPPEARAMD